MPDAEGRSAAPIPGRSKPGRFDRPALSDRPVVETKASFYTTPADRGLVERPLLTPDLEMRPLGEEAALLVSETFKAALYGRRYLDLVPLLDGTRTRHEIAAALSGRYGALEVQTALVSLATKGYVVSGEFSMGREAAALWCELGVSPRWAEERLGAARVEVCGDDGRMGTALEAMGVSGVGAGESATLVVVVTGDYLDESHAERNRGHLSSGTPWVLVKPGGVWPLFGPVFRPGEGGPCWACLSHRLRGNREVENFLRNTAGDTAAIEPRGGAGPFADAVVGLAATEIVRWLVVGEGAALHERVLSVGLYELVCEQHRVMRRPQCAQCGDEALYRADRAAVPVVLGPSPKPVWNSGGLRSVPPGETVRRYRHLVSPVSGVVTQLARTTDAGDGWLHVYWAGSNLALKADSLPVLRNSLRTKSSGKGSTAEQAEASALCEAVERYSGVFHGDEIRRRARYEDFGEGEALHPNEVMLYSERQYARAEEFNALGSRFNYVPSRFDPGVEMEWTPVWSLTAGRARYLPTALLYFSVPVEEGAVYCGDSNGCAAGNTLEEAVLQGFFELAERDAFACWWYNRVSLPEMDLESFGDGWLSGAREYYGRFHREVWLLDATNDLGVPVFVAVSRRTDKEAEDILFAPGAHSDPRIAALRAVCELNQYLSTVRDVTPDGKGYLHDDPETLWWWRNATLGEQSWLAPARGGGKREAGRYRAPETEDLREDVEYCRGLVEGKGLEFLVLDQTRPDVGMPVAKTLVPGLRHFWARFGPGRLYEVPVEMGWREAPIAEADLNPIPVFF